MFGVNNVKLISLLYCIRLILFLGEICADRSIQFYSEIFVEYDSSAVERRPLNRGSTGSNTLCYRFEAWTFPFSPQCLSSLGCINKCRLPGYRQWWKNVSE